MIFFYPLHTQPVCHSCTLTLAATLAQSHCTVSDILVTRTFLALLSESLDFCDAVSVSESVTWKSASAVM